MKKILPCILTGIMMAAVFSGCAGKPPENNSLPETDTVTELDDERYVNLYGRTFYSDELGGRIIVNSASGFEVSFRGTSLSMSAQAITALNWDKSMYSVFVDGETDSEKDILSVRKSLGWYMNLPIVEGLPEGEHTVKVLKRTPSNRDRISIESLSTDGVFLAAPERPEIKLDFYGDSVACGEGTMREVTFDPVTGKYDDSNNYTPDTYNVFMSFAGSAARELNAEFNMFGRGGISLKFINPNTEEFCILNNYRSMAVDLSVERGDCPEYDYSSFSPDAVVICLGTNDYTHYYQGVAPGLPTGLVPAFCQFLREAIAPNYGYDIPIFLCSNQTGSYTGLRNHMEDVKSQMISEFPNIVTVVFDPCAIGHPVAEEGRAAGHMLAEAIRAKLASL